MLASSAHTKGGQTMFPIFSYDEQNFFCQRWAMAQWAIRHWPLPRTRINFHPWFCIHFSMRAQVGLMSYNQFMRICAKFLLAKLKAACPCCCQPCLLLYGILCNLCGQQFIRNSDIKNPFFLYLGQKMMMIYTETSL